MAWTVSWFAIILFVELMRLTGTPFKKQEAAVLYLSTTTSVLNAGVALTALYGLYFVNSPTSLAFGLKDLPSWYAPRPETGIWYSRDFLDQEWIVPVSIMVFNSAISGLTWMMMGLFARRLYVEIEHLQFPIETVTSETILTLTGRDQKKLSVFSITATIGFVYGLFLYGLPLIVQSLGYKFQFIPVPWVDFNYFVEWFFPGASLGIATDVLFFAIGLVLPFKVIIAMFISSFSIHFLGNWLSVRYSLAPTKWWEPGMNIGLALQRSTLYLWASPMIGIGLAVGFAHLILHPKTLTGVFKFGRTRRNSQRNSISDAYSMQWVFIIFLIGSVANIILVRWLVPDFPVWWSVIIVVGFGIANTLITARIYGMTGQDVVFPLRNMGIWLSGYPNPDIWLAPMNPASGAGWCGIYKLGDLTGTSMRSFIKIWWVIWPLTMLMGFVYVRAFWRMAPIPSATYPGVEIFWPLQITYDSLWITRVTGLFRIEWVITSFAAMTILSAVVDFLALPISAAALVAGATMAIPQTLTLFVGGLSSVLIARSLGKKWFEGNKQVAASGLAMGEGIGVIICCVVALVIRSAWVMPY